MAYCRFSDDDFRCDVYCYESEGGFEIHVAARKYVSDEPFPKKPDHFWDLPPEEMTEVLKRQHDWIDHARLEPLGLAYDGKTFSCDTPGEAAETLTMLGKAGYRVPPVVIEMLIDEEKERVSS